MELEEKQKNYNNSHSFERYCNRALKFDKRISETNNGEFLGLIEQEKGIKVQELQNFGKRLQEVKAKLKRATKIMSENSTSETDKKNLDDLFYQIDYIQSTNDIAEKVNLGLTYTKEFM